MQFKSKKTYTNHYRCRHTGETPFSCTKCPRKYSSQNSLGKHMTMNHPKQSETCEICFKVFQNAFYLKKHYTSIHAEKSFVCTVADCKHKFATSAMLKSHTYSHSNFKKFVCNKCQASFKSR